MITYELVPLGMMAGLLTGELGLLGIAGGIVIVAVVYCAGAALCRRPRC